MKTFLFIAAAAHAQDFTAEDAGERYFFTATTVTTGTTATTTTTTTLATDSCWKCDQMTYSECASLGEYESCELGEAGSCFLEIREVYGKLKQLCTGCKSLVACRDIQSENFVDANNLDQHNDQCRPSYHNQMRHGRNGAQQSVCRTCFQQCKNTRFGGAFCFGSINANTGKEFMIPFATSSANYPGLLNPVDSLALGIPTYAFLDCTTDTAACDKIADFTYPNIYFNNNVNGKTAPTGNSIRTLDEMTYWGLQGADRTWWNSDLVAIQDVYQTRLMADGCTGNGASDATFQLSSCASGFTSTDLTP